MRRWTALEHKTMCQENQIQIEKCIFGTILCFVGLLHVIGTNITVKQYHNYLFMNSLSNECIKSTALLCSIDHNKGKKGM